MTISSKPTFGPERRNKLPVSPLRGLGCLTKATLQSNMASYDMSLTELWRHSH